MRFQSVWLENPSVVASVGSLGHDLHHENFFERLFSIMFLAGGVFVMISWWMKHPPRYVNFGFWVGCFFTLSFLCRKAVRFDGLKPPYSLLRRGWQSHDFPIGPDAGRYQISWNGLALRSKLPVAPAFSVMRAE
jgi:hypothetical protein